MTDQLLIYKTAVPVTLSAHAGYSIETGTDYAFCAGLNSVPLMAIEFPSAAGQFPIVFGGTGTDLMPAAVLGLRANENLFVGPGGVWNASYVPAFLRRYPFAFSRIDEERFILCIDETFPGFNRDGRGQRLFTDDGVLMPHVNDVVRFLQDYNTRSLDTKRFCDRLLALDLLEPMRANGTIAGEPWTLTGFQVINRERLKSLPPETIAELMRGDELELIYLHLHSLRAFETMPQRLATHAGG